MSVSIPTARGHLNLAKTTYISWCDYDFELESYDYSDIVLVFAMCS